MMDAELPYSAWLMALLSLPGMGPARLAQVLEQSDAVDAWQKLLRGTPLKLDRVPRETVEKWRSAARAFDVKTRWSAAAALGMSMSEIGGSGYPDRLIDDIEPPTALFHMGHPVPVGPTVAIVGTRRCTSYGRRVAFELGAALSAAGVSIVSGLALGIDAAAHQGALSVAGALPVAVVGSGLDVVYPRRNQKLWERLGTEGTILSEAPPGAPPEAWRFPARNRIIAGLADFVLVVESHAAGGSLLTVDEAQLRDVPVGAIPGPITSAASAGSNQLLVDGAIPVVGADDIMIAIGHSPTPPKAADGTEATTSVISTPGSDLLEQMGWQPLLFEQICLLTSADPSLVATQIEQLVQAGFCTRSGAFVERVR
ncbi:MAG: DNA-protecting protein DprA [Acidimicrobiales bacterium]|nr:DNA-protecting protein DprA [Acidimicrobiales bacterium]